MNKETTKSLFAALADDFLEAYNELNENATEYMRRSYIRTMFATVEGQVFSLKQLALTAYKKHGVTFTHADLALLKEESYELNGKGESYVQVKFLRIADNIKFTFNAVARAFKSNFQLKLDDSGWDSFKKAILIRNRITHPKVLEDLHISDEELEVIEKGAEWFTDSMVMLLKDCKEIADIE